MTQWWLEGFGTEHRFELPLGRTLVVGRAPASAVLIPDVTVSRRHAELTASVSGVRMRDLGSSNGTAINGARVTEGALVAGDTLAFGKVSYRLVSSGESRGLGDATVPGTVVRQVELGRGVLALSEVPAIRAHEQATRLARLLDLATRPSGAARLDNPGAPLVELCCDLP